MPMASREIVAAIGLLIFSALYSWATFYIPDRTIPNTPGPSFFPFVLISIVTVLSLALLIKGITGLRTAGEAADPVSRDRRPVGMLGAFVVFLAILPWAGFLIAGVLFFAALMVLYGGRSPLAIGLWSLAIPAALYVIFTQLFQIILPAGLLGF